MIVESDEELEITLPAKRNTANMDNSDEELENTLPAKRNTANIDDNLLSSLGRATRQRAKKSAASTTEEVLCGCGCGEKATGSHHACKHCAHPMMAWCTTGEGFGSKGICAKCKEKRGLKLCEVGAAAKKSTSPRNKLSRDRRTVGERWVWQAIDSDNEVERKDFPPLVQSRLRSGTAVSKEVMCGCGCGEKATGSRHSCKHCAHPMMAWCTNGEGFGSKGVCAVCKGKGLGP